MSETIGVERIKERRINIIAESLIFKKYKELSFAIPPGTLECFKVFQDYMIIYSPLILLYVSATVSEHTMLLEGTANRPPPGSSGPVTGAEIMRKLSKTHTHSDSALKIKVHGCCLC